MCNLYIYKYIYMLSNTIQDFKPLVTNGLSHPYHLDEYTFILRGIVGNSAFCGVTSGAMLFAYVP